MRRVQHAGTRSVTSEAFAYELSRGDILLLALVIAIPIPVFALSGATIPLPEIVQRVAASLVPGGTETTAAETPFAPLERGTILLAAGEAADAQPVAAAPTPRLASSMATRRSESPRPAPASPARHVAAGRTSPPGRTRLTGPAPRVRSRAVEAVAAPGRVSSTAETSASANGRETTGSTPAATRPPATDPAPPVKKPKRVVDTGPLAVTADRTGVSATVVVPVGNAETSPAVGVQSSGSVTGGRTTVTVEGPVHADVTLPVVVGAPPASSAPAPAPAPAPAQSPQPPVRRSLPLLGK